MASLDMAPTTFGNLPMKLAAVAILQSEIACVNAAGYITPGADATLGLIAVGIARSSVDNSGGAPGDKSVAVLTSIDGSGGRRVFPLLNAAAGAACTQANVGRDVFIAGPNTVRKDDNGGTCSRAGKCWGFDRDGMVLVEFDIDPDAVGIAALEADVTALQAAAIAMQAADVPIASGTGTLAAGITIAANSEVLIKAKSLVTGSTNFASYEEDESARVVGGPGVGSVTINALGNDGNVDADAAGTVRIVILTPLF